MKPLAFFMIFLLVACNQSHKASRVYFDLESKQLESDFQNLKIRKCNCYLRAMLYDTIGINKYELIFCKSDSMFIMRKYAGQKWDSKGKERFHKFFYGKYGQINDTFPLTFIKAKPDSFSNKLYYVSDKANLIGIDNGIQLKFHLWKRNYDFYRQNVKPKYTDYTAGLFTNHH